MKVRTLLATTGAATLAALGLMVSVAPAASADAFGVQSPVVATGSGTVTISWAGFAAAYEGDPPGNVLHFCAASATVCIGDRAILLNYRFMQDGETSVTLSAGMPLGEAPLAPGTYKVQMVTWTPEFTAVGDLLTICIGEACAADTPIPPWVQGYGRASADAVCDEGWSPGWELWPNAGSGGWVCTREIPSLG